MDDEIKQRLHDTSEHCFKCYEAWRQDEKDVSKREALQVSIHELRKVASRLEIEVAVSERKEAGQKPIAIPPHRDARRRSAETAADDNIGNAIDNGDDEDDNSGGNGDSGERVRRSMQQRRRNPRRSGGGQGGDGGNGNTSNGNE